MHSLLRSFFLILALSSTCYGCKSRDTTNLGPITPVATTLTVSTDKAVYTPGQAVTFSLGSTPSAALTVQYKAAGKLIKEEAVSTKTWEWTPPSTDFTGYMVELYQSKPDGSLEIAATIAVDVSSDWTRYPRYGFLSQYGALSDIEIQNTIDKLKRYHINGLQFYDWQWKHHRPLAGDPASPMAVYKEIANRDVYFATVKKYIDAAHGAGMKAMFYNLVFGALSDGPQDGVQDAWYMYTDRLHANKDNHHLDPPFKSSIYLLNPAHTGWQSFIANENAKVYQALPFDGYHMDQLGPRGARYTYTGQPFNLEDTYGPFIRAMKEAHPSKKVVMNAVSQFGQSSIASAGPDFLYTEVWTDYASSYTDLARVIRENDAFSGGSKATVLAAYMNYTKAQAGAGTFNTPGVLMADAVILANGGSHLEMGEHMLCSEYFPNANLAMSGDLQSAITAYYDFQTAYENLLRDGTYWLDPQAATTTSGVRIGGWPATKGQIATLARQAGSRTVLHFLNYTGATHMDWRDDYANQTAPTRLQDVDVSCEASGTIRRIWIASPDIDKGASKVLSFTQTGNRVSFRLPALQYWDMVVLEY